MRDKFPDSTGRSAKRACLGLKAGRACARTVWSDPPCERIAACGRRGRARRAGSRSFASEVSGAAHDFGAVFAAHCYRDWTFDARVLAQPTGCMEFLSERRQRGPANGIAGPHNEPLWQFDATWPITAAPSASHLPVGSQSGRSSFGGSANYQPTGDRARTEASNKPHKTGHADAAAPSQR
jgi:hypothetical protein